MNQHSPKVFKTCLQCEQSKPRTHHFHRYPKKGDGWSAICKDCTKERTYCKAHPDSDRAKALKQITQPPKAPKERGDLLLDAHWRGCAGWGEVIEVQQKWRMAA